MPGEEKGPGGGRERGGLLLSQMSCLCVVSLSWKFVPVVTMDCFVVNKHLLVHVASQSVCMSLYARGSVHLHCLCVHMSVCQLVCQPACLSVCVHLCMLNTTFRRAGGTTAKPEQQNRFQHELHTFGGGRREGEGADSFQNIYALYILLWWYIIPTVLPSDISEV